jgi:hypothetical protein
MNSTNSPDLGRNFMRLVVANCLLFVARENFAADETYQLKFYMQAAAESLPCEQLNALAKIKDVDRRYLAVPYYLGAGESLASRWSWTSSQIQEYEQSPEFKEALAEIEKISARFALDNPQYRLYANTRIRSLEEQLTRWQTVRSIGVAASQFRKAALRELAQEDFASPPNDESTKRFRHFLVTWRASPPPSLAAPGLSLHGQGRAYDFQIRDLQGRTIAGADTSTIRNIWDGAGWAEKLATAVHAASKHFVGPLATPREPWHYEYRPE